MHPEHLQREYYARTAGVYDALHLGADDEHQRALAWLTGLIQHHAIRSVLDVGCGTGRALRYLKQHCPGLRVLGVEPSAELGREAIASGIDAAELCVGDATALEFADNSFDLVCEFGVLHHIQTPRRAVSEMLRVARLGVFISDDNHFAAGSAVARRIKWTLHALGLWKAAYWLRSGGKGYRVSEGDGLSYPYSAFDDLSFLRAQCEYVQCAGTDGGGPNLARAAAHVALFGRKRSTP